MEEKREKEKERTRQRKEAEVALQRHLTESDARGIRQVCVIVCVKFQRLFSYRNWEMNGK